MSKECTAVVIALSAIGIIIGVNGYRSWANKEKMRELYYEICMEKGGTDAICQAFSLYDGDETVRVRFPDGSSISH